MNVQDALEWCEQILTETDIDLMEWQAALDRVSLAGVGVPSLELWSGIKQVTSETVAEYADRDLSIFMTRVNYRRKIGTGRVDLQTREVEVSLPERVLELGRMGLKGVHLIPLQVFKGFEPAVPKLQGLGEWITRKEIVEDIQERERMSESRARWMNSISERLDLKGSNNVPG